MSKPSSPIPVGQHLAGKYRIERVIGAGSIGVIVQAWDSTSNQPVAIKFFHPDRDQHKLNTPQLLGQIRSAITLRNKHVARTLEVGLYGVNPTPYIVLEYLQGRDISTELRRLGSLPARDAIRFTLEACDAMEEAHRKGIVHRALKPSSLFLHQQEQQLLPQLKVLNFGCAPKTGVDTTNLPLDYRSPEQLRPTGEVNCQTDIWSLGVILHQMVQGELPYSSDSKQQLLEAIAAGERSLLTERNANLAALEGVVSRCLEQDPEHRYCSIPDLKAALRRCREEAHHQVKPCPQSVAVQEIVPAALQATVQALAPTEEPTHRLASSTVTNCPKYGSAHAQLPVKTVAVVTRSLQPECKDDTAGHPIP